MKSVLKLKLSPELCEHAGSIEVEGAVHPIESDEEHQDDQEAQRLKKCSLFPPVCYSVTVLQCDVK